MAKKKNAYKEYGIATQAIHTGTDYDEGTEAGSTAAMSAILRIDLEVRSDWWILQSPEPTSSSRLAPGDFLLSAIGKIF